jgi:hypothetical protein
LFTKKPPTEVDGWGRTPDPGVRYSMTMTPVEEKRVAMYVMARTVSQGGAAGSNGNGKSRVW